MALPNIVSNLLNIAHHGRVDNTYKVIWGMSIVNLCEKEPERESIALSDIAERMVAYYWNLHIFFDPKGVFLKEGSNPEKPPKLLQIVLGGVKKRVKLVHF